MTIASLTLTSDRTEDIFAFIRRIRTVQHNAPFTAVHAGRRFTVDRDDTPDVLYDRWFEAREVAA